jgi:glycosyltransferase involved in cell wall biosynthesis
VLSKSISGLLSWIRKKWTYAEERQAFDPVFYLRCYPDLASIDSAKGASAHYMRHGHAEGRYPNAQRKDEADYERYAIRSANFDLTAYRELNSDLRANLATDSEFILHYIRHGRAEGRLCIFEEDVGNSSCPSWQKLLSVSQYSAWITSDEPVSFASRADAIEHFCLFGIKRLAPLRFDLVFEPEFYRAAYASSSHPDNVSLYRLWLGNGLDQGEAPNEARFLYPYLGASPFPKTFNWKKFAAVRMSSRRLPGRWAVLAHLFEKEQDLTTLGSYIAATDQKLIEAIAGFRLRQGKVGDAAAVLALLAKSDAIASVETYVLSGDLALSKGQAENARYAFERALQIKHHGFNVLARAVQTTLDCGAFARTFALLREHRQAWLGDPRFETLARCSINKIYERSCAQAHSTLCIEVEPDSDFVTAWSADFEERLIEIAAAIETIELAPAKLGPQFNGPVILLANEDIRQCTHYRVEQKREQFAAAGISLIIHAVDNIDGFMADLIGARAVIFYRVPATLEVMRAILTARGLGITTYYDIDDLLFCAQSYPDNFASYGGLITGRQYQGLRFGVPLFAAALTLCDRAIASTEPLLAQMRSLVRDRRGILLPNGFDSRNKEFLELGDAKVPRADGIVRIFYGSGTLAHTHDFSQICVPALVRILAQHPRVELVLVGHVAHDALLTPYLHRIRRFPILISLDDYWALLSVCDINVAVLSPGLANDCKSEIKWLEAAMFSIPTIASVSATMQIAITDGIDGLLATGIESWYSRLADLVGDPERRWAIGRTAYERASAHYSLAASAQRVRGEFASIKGSSPSPRQLRVLVVNVFFAPQSIGGATRVVENNVLHITQDCPDILLGVVCTDQGQEMPYHLRTSQFGQTPVFRIATPTASTEMQAFDEEVAAPFRSILARFRPDLVHFHCIQRLTATVVRECRSSGTPYLVTLHDAWWFSPWQFLTDPDGIVKMPPSDLLGEQTLGRGEQALARRQLLRAQLLGAEQVLTVSESFAGVCRDALLLPVSVVANGLPDLQPLEPVASSSGILRLAHIGGRSSHKGADLIEAALRRGNYPHLSLLMIDGTLAPGETRETIWGSSQVILAAPWSQNEVAQLYGRIDVLLALSTWPESYGLVAREAEYYGLWVVASTSGGIGEGVIDGANGFRIDVGDRRALDEVLAKMNAEPQRFCIGTASRTDGQRHARDQAIELAVLYREVVAKSAASLASSVTRTPEYFPGVPTDFGTLVVTAPTHEELN